jgi:hypothetical protein
VSRQKQKSRVLEALFYSQGIEQSLKLSYTFAQSEDGKTISDAMREQYWKYVVEQEFSNPSKDIFKHPSFFTAATNNLDSVGLIARLKRILMI